MAEYGLYEDDQLARLARHDNDAFAELYRRHLPSVYRYVMSRTHHADDSQDITAQTFITAMERIEMYRPEGKFLAWLLTIARHKAIDHFRKYKNEHSLDDAEWLPASTPSPDEAVGRKMQMEHIQEALNQLAPDRAEALRLRLFGELSAREIGEQMGKTEAAVKMLIHRAWQDFRQRLNIGLSDAVEE